MSLQYRILGCGSSGGVPRIDGDWGECDPTEPKNKRSRCSLLVSSSSGEGTTNLLIDTSPDMREQLIAAQAGHIDAVAFTHDHADQSHGIDDLRALAYKFRQRIPVWMDERTSRTITDRFAYCFRELNNSGYPSILEEKRIDDTHAPIEVSGAGGLISAKPFPVEHGRITALGYRFGNVVYTPDVSEIPDESVGYIEDVDTWVVDALRPTPHPTHFHLEKTLAYIEKFKVKQAFLTNLHIDMDYKTLCDALPQHVQPSYDGLVFS
ncbi:MAG: MBL fold metallo-hydrolase [Parvibaculales bacterium]